jgi:two-component system sensor histidine kinase/response regulator
VKSTGISNSPDRAWGSSSPATLLPSPLAPDSTAVSSQLVPVNVSVLESLVGGNRQLIEEILREYCDSTDVLGRELLDCCRASRPNEAAEIAHKLKSSARSVGALKLGDLCEVIESAGFSADVAACSRLSPQFEAELDAVIRFLRGMKRQGALTPSTTEDA